MNQNETDRMHRKVMNSKLMDDEFFRVCVRDNPLAIQLILRIILDDDKLIVESMKTQEDMKDLFGKSSWFDVHAIDKNGRHLDIEIQNANEGADKIHYPELRDRIASFKNTKVGEGQVSEEFQQWLNESKAEGKEEEKIESATRMITQGKFSLEDIATALDIEIEKVQELAESFKSKN